MKPHNTQCVDEGHLQAYRDGALADAERDAVVSHLSTCVSCRHRVEGLDTVASQVSALMLTVPYPPNPEAALARLRSRQAEAAEAAEAVEASRTHGLEQPLNTIPRMTNILAQRRPDMRTGIARRPLRLGLAFAFTIALVALGAVTLFNRPAPAGAAEILDKAHEAIASTQEGKVRHIVTSITNKRSGGGETSTTTEDWLATEGGRQLAKSVGPYNSSNLVADGTAVWIHFPQAKVVHKLTNGQKGLGGYISNRQMIEQMLKMPNTTIVGNSTLNGRAVIIIEGRDSVAGSKVELKPAPENGDTKDALLAGPVSFDLGDALPPDGSVYYRAWVDSQTYQIVQQEFGSISASGVAEVHSVRKVLVDELRNRSEFPDDLFTFKAPEGVKVVEMKDLPDLPEIRQSDKPGVSETPVP